MDTPRYLECLRADAARLREVAAEGLAARVPTCPDWTVRELVEHVATVYLHKAETMRRDSWPDPWPPDVSAEQPLELMDRTLADLLAELESRSPGDKSLTWYEPDQTVGFWTRRMAQETVIHRVDAELAAGAPLAPIPADLAVDGVDELLRCFFAYATANWPDDFGAALPANDGRTLSVVAGDHAFHVRLATSGAVVTASDSPAEATISGSAADVLLWLWRRPPATEPSITGDRQLATTFHDMLQEATQ